ncbi:(2,3-dihydroxybenzoyl)adenylate synthase [Actinomadura nitritigenes]|uniref:(2,3-dihydroxybenzoyl)adenylate synthase n=1 Tax=Actinomadura nitritigenes TaxID=134602 RepID=UPI003D93672E
MTIFGDGPAEHGDVVPYPPAVRERYRRAGLWRRLSLGAELARAATRFAERTALITAEVRWSYAELDRRATAFGAGLLAATSLRPGDAVMFSMGNVAETVVAYYGALRAGLVPVCTLPMHRSRELGLLAEHTGARGHIVQADYRDHRLVETALAVAVKSGTLTELVVARGSAPSGGHAFERIAAAGADPQARWDLAAAAPDPESVAVFQLSGGTTGLPKIAPRLHEEYAYNARCWAERLGYGPGVTVLYPLPIMHNAGISLALQPAHLTGATVILTDDAAPGTILDAIDAHRPQVLPLVPPAVAIRLLDASHRRKADLSCVTAFVVGGQRLPTEIAHRLETELGVRCRQMFGMAEGMFMLTPPGARDEIRLQTVGAPISPDDEVRVYGVGTEQEVPDGQLGELCTRGPYTIRGYYRAAAHNERAFTPDGFYRTGDLARRHRVDGRDHYSIDGRIKDVINRGVEKIHAEEVEELILHHPHVAEAAVVAMPDEVLGERACAYLVMAGGAAPPTVETLGAHLLAHGLAKYKLPERVEIVAGLPVTNVGKVSKKDLRADIAAKLGGPEP